MTTTITSDKDLFPRVRKPAVAIPTSLLVVTLRLLIIAMFCQIWFNIAGFTVRIEDLIALFLLATLLFSVLWAGKVRFYQHVLSIPLLFWCAVLALGIAITLVSPYDGETKKNALVNGVRLIFAFCLFFVVFHYPLSAEKKIRVVVSTVLIFSFVTTTVLLLQMGYWDGWLPFQLPAVLVTFKDEANTARGRELFALYLGDTGTHTWSGALAMQALLVWLLSHHAGRSKHRVFAKLYFGLLVFILVRISVRNSILGLFIAIVGLELLRRTRTRYFVFRMIRPILVLIGAISVIYVLFMLAPDSYFVERVRQAIPQFEDGKFVISPASNVYGRFDYWVTAIKIFFSFPTMGGGFYSYQALSGVYGSRFVIHAHNSYFQTLAELGLFGMANLVLLILTTIYYLNRSRRILGSHKLGAFWWEYVTGSFIFLGFIMIFSNAFGAPNYVAFRMILLGVLANVSREQIQ